jgi:hypothetical protein
MAKKEKVTAEKIVDDKPDFTVWEIVGKALPKFILTAGIRDVRGTFISEGGRFRTDMRGLTPGEVVHWMHAIMLCMNRSPKGAADYLVRNGFTAELFEEEMAGTEGENEA